MNLDITHEERVARILFLREFRHNLLRARMDIGLTGREVVQYDKEIRQVKFALKRLDPDGIFSE